MSMFSWLTSKIFFEIIVRLMTRVTYRGLSKTLRSEQRVHNIIGKQMFAFKTRHSKL